MTAPWTRRAAAATLAAASLLLAACGSGSVVSPLTPTRFMAVGDGFIDLGHDGHRYTINDGSPLWTQQLAAHYGLTLTDVSAGGFSYARGNARIIEADPTGGGAPSVAAQIGALLQRTPALEESDVILLSAGITDVVAAVQASGISPATTEAVKAAGTALGEQAQRLVNAGAKHVVVSGVYNLGLTPWARARGEADAKAITQLSVAFNSAMLLSIADPKWGRHILAVDPALFYNLVANAEQSDIANKKDPVCTTPDATTCTLATLVPGADPNTYLFADSLYLTPYANRMYGSDAYGDNVYSKFKDHW